MLSSSFSKRDDLQIEIPADTEQCRIIKRSKADMAYLKEEARERRMSQMSSYRSHQSQVSDASSQRRPYNKQEATAQV